MCLGRSCTNRLKWVDVITNHCRISLEWRLLVDDVNSVGMSNRKKLRQPIPVVNVDVCSFDVMYK